jgi:hypothetical protein
MFFGVNYKAPGEYLAALAAGNVSCVVHLDGLILGLLGCQSWKKGSKYA